MVPLPCFSFYDRGQTSILCRIWTEQLAATAGVQKKRSAGWNSNTARPPIGRDKEETPQSLTDMLPDWMGYGFLYFVTIIPAIIVVITISIVFFSSLK